ncbi:MAG: M48 family metallopeptidase [Bacillota bacterium]
MKEIIVEDIQIQLRRKNIKTLRLSVHPPNGEVRISVPNGVSDDAAIEFIKSKMQWINLQRKKLKKTTKEYIPGEKHLFLGNEYQLQIQETSAKQRAQIEDGMITLLVRNGHTREKRESLLNEWYREQLKEIIPGYIAKWEPIMGVKVKDFGVKNMKTRWGTCNIREQRIWLNLRLAIRDERLLEYIVVHEMTHLLERLHNHRFKMLMTRFIPNWRDLKKELNGQK